MTLQTMKLGSDSHDVILASDNDKTAPIHRLILNSMKTTMPHDTLQTRGMVCSDSWGCYSDSWNGMN